VATIRRELFPGEVLFRQGDPAGCAWLVERGEVVLQVESEAGPQPPRVFGSGELIGELALLDGAPYRATAVARDDAVLLAIDADQFDERLRASDPIVMALVDSLRSRMRALQEALPAGTPLPLEDQPCDDPEERAGIAKIHFETQLREALDQGTLEVHYQPILDLQAGRIGGYEALVRWKHDELGQVSPADFIRLAEETSLIVPLGEYVLDRAIDVLRGLHALHGDAVPSIAVNLSARQFRAAQLAVSVHEILDRTGVDPALLQLEITESFLANRSEAVQSVQALTEAGVSIAIDDFGTGYSNLSSLKRFAVDTVKIDRSFVRDIDTDDDDAAIVRAIINMAHSLNLTVVAEGVENQAQLDFLRQCRCDEIQGYYVAYPAPAEEQVALLRLRVHAGTSGAPAHSVG